MSAGLAFARVLERVPFSRRTFFAENADLMGSAPPYTVPALVPLVGVTIDLSGCVAYMMVINGTTPALTILSGAVAVIDPDTGNLMGIPSIEASGGPSIPANSTNVTAKGFYNPRVNFDLTVLHLCAVAFANSSAHASTVNDVKLWAGGY